jgi:hypothetical protein
MSDVDALLNAIQNQIDERKSWKEKIRDQVIDKGLLVILLSIMLYVFYGWVDRKDQLYIDCMEEAMYQNQIIIEQNTKAHLEDAQAKRELTRALRAIENNNRKP